MIKSAEEFVKLRESEKEEEYLRAARESASIEVWKEVIDKYPYMKKWVAYNKSVPNEILQILAEDTDTEVRAMVAMRRSSGEQILDKLAHDEDEIVRRRVLYNPKISKTILEAFLYDPVDDIREIAKEKMEKIAT